MNTPFVRLLLVATLLTAIVGCGNVPKPASENKSKSKTKDKEKPAAPKEEPIDPNAFASYEEALAAIVAATAEQKPADMNKAERWLGLQGEKIAAKLSATVKDNGAPLAARISACRVLARIGPVATATLMEVSKKETKPDQLRQNGVQWMGVIKPTSKEIVDQLIALSNESTGTKELNQKIRVAALQALLKIGPDVKKLRPDYVETLQNTLNSQTEDDSIRGQAKLTLKSIEPRRGFSGMGSIEKK
jgi:hypothetical protein